MITAAGRAAMAGRFPVTGMRETGIVSGVCADLAARAGVPAWVPRAAMLVFGVAHWLLAVVLYAVLSRLLTRGETQASAAGCTVPAPPGAVRDRFGALDARLAALEAATLQQESDLRRAFRDLERS